MSGGQFQSVHLAKTTKNFRHNSLRHIFETGKIPNINQKHTILLHEFISSSLGRVQYCTPWNSSVQIKHLICSDQSCLVNILSAVKNYNTFHQS
jgi:hypothetical protein